MHVYKRFLPLILPGIFYLNFTGNLFAYARKLNPDSALKRDTGKVHERRYTNREFNAIFEQNLRTSFAGNEFFDPNATLLVADLSPNFILLNTPKLPFFFCCQRKGKPSFVCLPRRPCKIAKLYARGHIVFSYQ